MAQPSALGFRNIIGTYFARLEAVLANGWADAVSMSFDSDQESETYKWLGQTPAMREWVGGRLARGLSAEGITIPNRTFEATLDISADDIRRDKTPQIMTRVQDLAERNAEHWHKLLTEVLTGNPLCYDGQNFLDTDHAEGASGTQINACTNSHVSALAVTTATAPTVAEMEAVITGLVQHMLAFKDDQGEPMNANARSFMVMVPTSLWAATAGALNLPVIVDSGASRNNLLVNLGGYTFEARVNPRLTSGTQLYVFRTDTPSKPLIRQVELDEGIRVKDDTFDNNRYLFGVKAIRATGPGYWQYVVRGTLS